MNRKIILLISLSVIIAGCISPVESESSEVILYLREGDFFVEFYRSNVSINSTGNGYVCFEWYIEGGYDYSFIVEDERPIELFAHSLPNTQANSQWHDSHCVYNVPSIILVKIIVSDLIYSERIQ